jgi:hypothetical protein
MIFVAMLAGKGLYKMAEKVLLKIARAPQVQGIWILAPKHKIRNEGLLKSLPGIHHINSWEGPDSHDATGINRERLRLAIQAHAENMRPGPYPDWIWFGDDDALPADNFFDELEQIRYDYPVLLTGKTFNADGQRWYDICSFQTDHHPFCVPYNDWQNGAWAKDLYASGNQHILNWTGFSLNVPYPNIRGEDPHYCWAFRAAGGKLIFRPELECKLQKPHPYANYGHPRASPR